jgi:hypothetical protein
VTPASPTATEQVAALRDEVQKLTTAIGQLAVLVRPHISVPRPQDSPELWAIVRSYREQVNAREAEKEQRLAEIDAQRQAIEQEVGA